jgi:hypothetical protein
MRVNISSLNLAKNLIKMDASPMASTVRNSIVHIPIQNLQDR